MTGSPISDPTESQRARLRDETQRLLESDYQVARDKAIRLVELHFSDGYLPQRYFCARHAREIAEHILMLTGLLTSGTPNLRQLGADGKRLTYVDSSANDYPENVAATIAQNVNMDIASFDSERTSSGIRILTVKRGGYRPCEPPAEETKRIERLLSYIQSDSPFSGGRHARTFLFGLQPNYLLERVNYEDAQQRIENDLRLFSATLESDKSTVEFDEQHSVMSAAAPNLSLYGVLQIVLELGRHQLDIESAYFDRFNHDSDVDNVGIFTAYLQKAPTESQRSAIAKTIRDRLDGPIPPRRRVSRDSLKTFVHDATWKNRSAAEADRFLVRTREICNEIAHNGTRIDDSVLLANVLLDFFAAADATQLSSAPRLLLRLMSFEQETESFVSHTARTGVRNVPAYRLRHSSIRGAAKGGIRIDLGANHGAIAALAFLMTFKAGRAGLPFGGAKGGITSDPVELAPTDRDRFDTLSAFGSSLFLSTGPHYDVPAGDVGCGEPEIGGMLKGFRSALRDLALTAYDVKEGTSYVGSRVLSAPAARATLLDHFGIDASRDTDLLAELVRSEHYIGLVSAAHVTGKAYGGLTARRGATGRGVVYAILHSVASRYLDGTWRASSELTDEETQLLRAVTELDSAAISAAGAQSAISGEQWKGLTESAFPKLLQGKRVVVQGLGKVGYAVLRELEPYGVNIVAVADREGAIRGSDIRSDELKPADDPDSSLRVLERGGVRHCSRSDVERFHGAENAANVLWTEEIDILVLAALENVITHHNAERVSAKIVACGSNGPVTSAADRTLSERGVTVLHDLIASSGGVMLSYFEWLDALKKRFQYEQERIRGTSFELKSLDPYITPQFGERIRGTLSRNDSAEADEDWNAMLRDSIFLMLNEDYAYRTELSARVGEAVTLRQAAFARAQLAVLTALIAQMEEDERKATLKELPSKLQAELKPHLASADYEYFAAR